MQIEIDSRPDRLRDSRFVVVLTFVLGATSGENAQLVVELQQAGVFRIEEMDEEMRPRVLGVPQRAVSVCPGDSQRSGG